MPHNDLRPSEPSPKEKAWAYRCDHDIAAYKALIQKHSYTGPAKVFGRDYQAYYAPLIGEGGKLTGALFVGVPK
jgi:methyl-accepting chemotaxis protein